MRFPSVAATVFGTANRRLTGMFQRPIDKVAEAVVEAGKVHTRGRRERSERPGRCGLVSLVLGRHEASLESLWPRTSTDHSRNRLAAARGFDANIGQKNAVLNPE